MVAQQNLLALGIIFLDDFFFLLFSLTTLLIALLFLQLEIKALKLFDAIVSNFSLVVKKILDMISLPSYIQ
jgi:hypothetical protein